MWIIYFSCRSNIQNLIPVKKGRRYQSMINTNGNHLRNTRPQNKKKIEKGNKNNQHKQIMQITDGHQA